MKVIYAQQPLETEGKTIFLAGPTPRKESVQSWRPEALIAFRDLNFDGTVLLPEFRDNKDWKNNFAYDNQIIWEQEAMELADIVLFWIPRSLPDMPAFTTNTEYGYWLAKDPVKIVLGIPKNAVKCDYIKYTAKQNLILVHTHLEDLVKYSVNYEPDYI